MKKLFKIYVAVASVLFITALIINPVSAQSAQKGGEKSKAIPDSVMKIAEKSCVSCHAEPGNGMALSHVNLSKWDKYSPEKQAAKAKDMCNMVSKGKMPKKSFTDKHPEGIPTKDDIKTLCAWAESLQVTKK